jgi:hypothetical protein
MSAKAILSTALVLTAFSFGAARAQTPYNGSPNPLDTLPAPGPVDPIPGGMVRQPVSLQPSSWIRGDKYQCCDAVGGNGPILYDLFFRTGPSVPLGHGQLADVLQTGLYLGAGGRVLFFEPSMDAAWTVELGLANISNHAHSSPNGIALDILVPNAAGTPQQVFFGRDPGVPPVTLQSINRTFFDVGFGREWYLWGAVNCHGPSWRVGIDGGARYGSERATFHEITHRTDTIAGAWAAAHTDLEIPCGSCVLEVGFRIEWGYTWSDILQIQNNSDNQDLNFLFNIGIRF